MLLGALMLLAVGQIVLRVFFSSGLIWADELVKLLVLWIALVASIAASRSDRHLRIDVLSHFVAEKYARVPRIVVDAFAAFICGVLAWQSWRYVQLTIEFEDTVLVDLPAWIAYGMLPFKGNSETGRKPSRQSLCLVVQRWVGKELQRATVLLSFRFPARNT